MLHCTNLPMMRIVYIENSRGKLTEKQIQVLISKANILFESSTHKVTLPSFDVFRFAN